jgi:GNAT superfamily N-acetyltransferase
LTPRSRGDPPRLAALPAKPLFFIFDSTGKAPIRSGRLGSNVRLHTPPHMHIRIAATQSEVEACFPAISTLRPHLDAETFVALVHRLGASTGLRIAYLDDGGIQCVAGFRISEWLAGGRYLEIEDLASIVKSRGHGGQLFDWLVDLARSESCDHLRLVSRVHRTDAHRFYERKGMVKEAYYFSMKL